MSDNKKILVIDDEEDLRENLKYILKKKGFEVELAENGLAGLKKLENFTPHLIILDLNMPKMGGIEFYQKICDNSSYPKYPIFVLTARANMEKFFKDFNVDGFMKKPFEINSLINEITIITEKQQGKEMSALVKGSKSKNVFIVEPDDAFSSKLGAALLSEGFSVNLAKNGTDAIERISIELPDIVLVNINLPDIAGDIVLLKLKHMAKTSGIKSLLYLFSESEKEVIADKIEKKEGIEKLIITKSESALVRAINEL